MEKNKVLIIRFSSFGDIVQCSSVVDLIDRNNPSSEIDWVTRAEFKELVELNSKIKNVFGFDRKLGFVGLFKLGMKLRSNNYDLIYDAHNNLRSNFLFLLFKITFSNSTWITRSKDRLKRILLFSFRINKFPKPFKGVDSFLNPMIQTGLELNNNPELVHYNFSKTVEDKIKSIIIPNKKTLTLVPSAAWEMKRWPLDYWKEIVSMNQDYQIYILGGKEDLFCEDICRINPNLSINLAGKLSLIESTCFIKHSDLVVSGDTGLLHVADVLGIKAISLMGPTAFGFTKSELIKTMEVSLDCRPCTKDGRGKCSQNVYQKCMIDITPSEVIKKIDQLI